MENRAVIRALTIASFGLALASNWNAAPISAKTPATAAIEKEIISVISKQSPSPILAANCPETGQPQAKKSFDCRLTIAEGTFPASVTFTDAAGNFQVRTKNILVVPSLEKQLAGAIKQANNLEVRANCGSGKVRFFEKVGETFTCGLTRTDGRSGTATIQVTTLEGGVDAKWKFSQ